MSGKQSWPELVGAPIDEAVSIIQNEDPSLNVVKLQVNSPTTRDFRRERVRVFYDDIGNVASEPRTG